MNDKIQCPNCGHSFAVEEALSGKLEARFKAEYEKKVAAHAEKLNADRKQIEAERAQVNELREKQDELLKAEVAKGVARERERIEKNALESYEEQLKVLQDENEKRKSENKALKEKEVALMRREAELKERQEEMELNIERQMKVRQKEIEDKAGSKAREQYEEQLKALQDENEKRKSENKALKEKEVALMRRDAELKERQEEMELNIEKQMIVRQKEIEEKARSKERESFELERIQYEKRIADQKKLAEEMRRKAEQGSMQMQGEVQELALEDLLARTYPFDQIREVPKGIRGADSIQSVINSMRQECGTIVYESKRTKNFAKDWIDKLKQDQLACKADIAVLVTETMPSDMDRFGERDGVWICGFHEVKSVSFVLREMLIKTHSVKLQQENKGDKMELLYNYLTSPEFVQNVQRIVDNYDSMIDQLNKEKKAMHKIWAAREKQIWVVQENLSALFGSIKGIAGKELDSANVLELPDIQIEE